MRKLLITIATDAIRDDAEPFLANQRSYCARNNYEYLCATVPVIESLHPSFSKVPLSRIALDDGFDVVIFADSDVAFMDQGVDLANLLIGTDFWFGAYWQQNFDRFKYLCCGLFVVKNCKYASEFFWRWTDCCLNGGPGGTPKIDHHPWEQWSASALFQEIGYSGIRCCSAAEIGSFSKEVWADDDIGWKPGYPTVHFAGQSKTMVEKAEIFRKHYAHLVH